MKKQVNFKNVKTKSLSFLVMIVCAMAITHLSQTTVLAAINRIVYSVIDTDKAGASLYVKSLNSISVPFTSLNEGIYDMSPTVSPDGSKIAFIREYLDGTKAKLMVIDADGTNEAVVYEDEYLSDPTWSPDGNQVAFTLGNDTTFLGRIYNGCAAPPSQIALYDFVDKKITIQGNTDYGTDPTWSPDGNTIAFVKTRDGAGIFSLNVSSGTVSLLKPEALPADPEWSPVGDKLVYGRNYQVLETCNGGVKTGGTPVPAPIYGGEVVVLDFSTGTLTTLAISLGSAPDWSPNGLSVIFSGSSTGYIRLYSVSSSGGTPILVPNSQIWSVSSSWAYF
jgi:Tol biopolymer transport system component